MAARITAKAVNDELARLGHQARPEKGSGYSVPVRVSVGRLDNADG